MRTTWLHIGAFFRFEADFAPTMHCVAFNVGGHAVHRRQEDEMRILLCYMFCIFDRLQCKKYDVLFLIVFN